MIIIILNILGLILNMLGVYLASKGLMITEKQALQIGVSRWSGGDEEDLKLPFVQEILKQSKQTKRGLIFMFLGFLLQLISSLYPIMICK